MSGARPESDHRFTPHGSTLRRAQGPEPSRGAFHGSWERAENDADGCGSFAVVERSMLDRLLSFHDVGGKHEGTGDGQRYLN